MKITKIHLDYWRERKASPAWANHLEEAKAHRSAFKMHVVSIDRVVNSHAPDRIRPTHNELITSNFIARLKLQAKTGRVIESLQLAANSTGTSSQARKERALAKKWLKRMNVPLPTKQPDITDIALSLADTLDKLINYK